MLLALTLAVSACSTVSPEPPIIRTQFVYPVIPAAAKLACKVPTKLPDRDITRHEVTTFWAKDRAALRACERKRKALISSLTRGSAAP